MGYKAFINNQLHLTVQKEIARIIGEDDVFLEYRFQGHIADIYWKKHNIVFEVQCSKMSLKECKKRTTDFERLGVRVIWILHQKNFNKPSVSPMELYLLERKGLYYTNISQNGEGIVFDQEEALCYGIRKVRSPPIKIDLCSPIYRNRSLKTHFKRDKKDLGLIKRFISYPEVWKEKWNIKKAAIQRKLLYHYTYLKWSIRM
jgi:competence CoiA-like predicted nuclease